LKFFPASVVGGAAAIAALGGPFTDVRFIPTGGINAANARDYLALPNVAAIGGSWFTTPALQQSGDFARITELTAQAVELAKGVAA